jgi:hypothetical protein
VGENLALARSNRQIPAGDQVIEALRFPPVIPVRDPSSVSGFGIGTTAIPTFGTNPVGSAALRNQRDRTNQAFGTLYAEAGLLQNLRYRVNVGVNYQDMNYRQFIRRASRCGRTRRSTPRSSSTSVTTAPRCSSRTCSPSTRRSGVHEVNAVAGYTTQRETYERVRGPAAELPRPEPAAAQRRHDEPVERGLPERLAAAVVPRPGQLHLRRPLSRHGEPPARRVVALRPRQPLWHLRLRSVGWVASEEDFFKNSALGRTMSFLKLRASYGTLGNQDFDDYQASARSSPAASASAAPATRSGPSSRCSPARSSACSPTRTSGGRRTPRRTSAST